MDKDTYKSATRVVRELSEYEKTEGLTPDQKQKLERAIAQLAGLLGRPWLPVNWPRRVIMIMIFLTGIVGSFAASAEWLYVWLLLPLFSPRMTMETLSFIGKIRREMRK